MATYENTFAEKHYLKAMAGMQSEDFFNSSLTGNRKVTATTAMKT